MQRLVRATNFKSDAKLIAETALMYNISEAEARELLEREIDREEVWVNEKYQVAVARYEHPMLGPSMQLNIRRRDGKPIFRDWREFQEIKNQLAHPEWEAVELYPAESRLVDTTNKYMLWVICNEDFRFPFGWKVRDVREASNTKLAGHKQRKLPPGWEPNFDDPKPLYMPACLGRGKGGGEENT